MNLVRRITFLSGRAPRGFTLSELLVAVSVIVILVAMLMPYMGGVSERAQLSICQNNLHKIGQAISTSASKVGSRLPADSSWVLTASTYGSREILICPKGSNRGGGANVTVSGGVEVIPAPLSSVFNDLESNDKVRMFQEREAFTLPTAVKVDISEPGRYDNAYGRSSATIPAGQMVDCFFLHFDPLGSAAMYIRDQKIVFSEDVLGIICIDGNLNASDAVLGNAGTVYETGRGCRGFEENQEHLTLESDRRTVTINKLYSTFPGEEFRILTRPGGESSYGINLKVESAAASPGQIYIAEYRRNKIDIDLPGWQEDAAPRHVNKSNVMFVDGSVKLLSAEQMSLEKGQWLPERR